MSKVYVHDRRAFPYYQVDNALIEKYGKHIGAYAIAVYNCLACHANREMIAFPSYMLIGKETGTSRSTAMRAIKTLIEWNIIQLVEDDRHREGTKEFENNKYLLMPQSAWKPLDVLTETGGVSQEPRIPELSGGVSQEPQVVSEGNRGGVSQEHKQESIQQESINKKQQQAPPVDVDSIATALFALGIRPNTLCSELATLPQAAAQIEWWPLRAGEVEKHEPGTLRRAIEQNWGAPKTAPETSHNGHKPRLSIQERRERFAPAYEAVWRNLSPALRATYEREGRIREEVIEEKHDNELQIEKRKSAGK